MSKSDNETFSHLTLYDYVQLSIQIMCDFAFKNKWEFHFLKNMTKIPMSPIAYKQVSEKTYTVPAIELSRWVCMN